MRSNGQGRLVQAQFGTIFQPAQLIRRPGVCKKDEAVMHSLAALRQCGQVGPGQAQCTAGLQSPVQAVQNLMDCPIPMGWRQHVGAGIRPGTARLLADGCWQGLQSLCCLRQVGRQSQPIGHAARGPAVLRGQQLGQRTCLRSAPTLPQELHSDVAELMRLVQNHRTYTGQQFGHARCAHPRIGKKQMVVYHHQLRLHGTLACLQGMAMGNFRATRSQAVFARGSHQTGQHRMVLQRT